MRRSKIEKVYINTITKVCPAWAYFIMIFEGLIILSFILGK